jgi:hypothetical protein
MRRNFTLSGTNYLRIVACILLMLSTGCSPATGNNPGIRLSAGQAENSHLKQIFLSRNGDSVRKCAWADYTKQQYYIFWSGMPGEARFNKYLAAYAKKRYNLILVECGCKNQPGAYYYNSQMDVFFSKAKKKPLYAIYLEAKNEYNKALLLM